MSYITLSDIINNISERINELSKNCEWCIYQIIGENRLNKHNDSNSMHNWITQLKENEIRIDELQKILKKLHLYIK